jgi:type IV secretion system protein VirB10
MQNTLRQQEAQLLDETNRAKQQLQQDRASQGSPPGAISNEDLQRAAAAADAAQARQQFPPAYGAGGGAGSQPASQQSQMQTEKQQQAYKSLFADNLVRQDATSGVSQPISEPREATVTPSVPASPAEKQIASADTDRKALDFNPAAQRDYWLPEGTVIEAVLTNRLVGDAVGPVNSMITTDVYLPGTRMLLIPQGARVLGEASKVIAFGQQRLAVAFHRIIVPGLRTYSIPLDKEPPALGQAGEVGLHDKVNSHYFSIFGASLAIGAIGGLAQIGNGYTGFAYDPSVQFRNGVSQSMAESSSRVLDRFLNRMPTVTIREGTRVKIVLTDDLQLPSYDSMHTGGL